MSVAPPFSPSVCYGWATDLHAAPRDLERLVVGPCCVHHLGFEVVQLSKLTRTASPRCELHQIAKRLTSRLARQHSFRVFRPTT